MKRILPLLCILMAPLCFHQGVFAEDATPLASGSNVEAESLMNQYFGALANGDAATLKMLLGGDLLKKRSSLLDNPDYSGYLSATYTNATFRILNYDTADPDVVRVDALITFNQDESIRKRYVLAKKPSPGGVVTYRIVSERSSAGTF